MLLREQSFLLLDKNVKFCYTYDNLSRVTKRETKDIDNTVISEEAFTYDAAGNITDAPESCFAYDTNNRLTVFCGQNVSYDLDGNMPMMLSLAFTNKQKCYYKNFLTLTVFVRVVFYNKYTK